MNNLRLQGTKPRPLARPGLLNRFISLTAEPIWVNSNIHILPSQPPKPAIVGGHMESLPVSMCYYFESRARSGMDSEVPGSRHGAVKNQIPYASKLGSEGQMEAKEWKRSLGLPLPQNFHQRAI